ncbi:hypothetical protein D3C80_1238380 [compost metagenome]
MVGTGLPQGIFTLHALVTDHGVHDGLLESVTHVQAAGNVRRRDHDAEAFLAGITIWLEVTLVFPVIVQLLFDLFRVVCGIEMTVCLFHFISLFSELAALPWSNGSRRCDRLYIGRAPTVLRCLRKGRSLPLHGKQ